MLCRARSAALRTARPDLLEQTSPLGPRTKARSFQGWHRAAVLVLCAPASTDAARMASSARGLPSTGHRLVLWFRNDLRLHDNSIVAEAARRLAARHAADVLPVFCFDPRFFKRSAWGTPKTGPHRAQFLLQSVRDLKQRLKGLGSDLVVHLGRPEELLPGLVADAAAGHKTVVLAQAESTSEEQRVERRVREALSACGGRLELVGGATMYHRDDLPFAADLSDLPDVFTPFKDKVESRSRVRPCLPAPAAGQLPLPAGLPPSLLSFEPTQVEGLNAILPAGTPPLATPAPDARGVLPFEGGETAALARLKYYLWDSDLLATYFDTRNGMIGGNYSTKFAPWLAHGCLSPRTIYHEIRKYESQRTKNKSTYWVIFELTWRDFYRFFAAKHGNGIFLLEGTARQRRPWKEDAGLFAAWREGRTGWPLVDANMRELSATGFMSNRGRQNVASFLALDLGLDWRLGADWFEHALIDYDVTANWGNWVAAAGLTGGRVNKFNISKQSRDYDPQGDYIRLWCPELKGVPASRIHEPWLMSRQEQEQYGVAIGQDYPDHIPVSSFSRGPAAAPGERPSRFGGGGRGGGAGGRRGGDGRGASFRPRSAFEMYG